VELAARGRCGLRRLPRHAGRLGLPGLAGGVPADETVRGNELGDAVECRGVVAAVDDELGDPRALVDDGDLEAKAGVRVSRLWAENELVLLGEEDPGPPAVALLDECGDDVAEDVLHLTAAGARQLDGLDRGAGHRAA